MSVENVSVVVNINTLKGRFITHKFSTGWTVGTVKSGKDEECCCVDDQFVVKYKTETYCWTKKRNKEDYGVDKYLVLLAVVKE